MQSEHVTCGHQLNRASRHSATRKELSQHLDVPYAERAADRSEAFSGAALGALMRIPCGHPGNALKDELGSAASRSACGTGC
jgi:hypothetical protein